MSEASAPASCPGGHDDTVKLLSTVAVTGSSRGGAPAPALLPEVATAAWVLICPRRLQVGEGRNDPYDDDQAIGR
jgi:hypothetical protein